MVFLLWVSSSVGLLCKWVSDRGWCGWGLGLVDGFCCGARRVVLEKTVADQ